MKFSKAGENILQTADAVNSFASGLGSAYEGDPVGLWTEIFGLYPPLAPITTAFSLGRNIGGGFENVKYVPLFPVKTALKGKSR
ncbi:MAG: hypothetical protein GY755_16145 [Chloroflexi bacterium]|nr:hypothetical protein [Chloroflexota bacterium]